jgi:hypothetical protein
MSQQITLRLVKKKVLIILKSISFLSYSLPSKFQMESFSAPTANDECEGWWDNGDADDSDAESLNSDVTDDDVSFIFIRHHSISILAVKIVFMQYIFPFSYTLYV